MKEGSNRPFPELIEAQRRQALGEAAAAEQRLITKERRDKRNDKIAGFAAIIAFSLVVGICLVGNEESSSYDPTPDPTPNRVPIVYSGTPRDFYPPLLPGESSTPGVEHKSPKPEPRLKP